MTARRVAQGISSGASDHAYGCIVHGRAPDEMVEGGCAECQQPSECPGYIVLDTMHCDLPPGHKGSHRIDGMSGGPVIWDDETPTRSHRIEEAAQHCVDFGLSYIEAGGLDDLAEALRR